MKRIGTGVKNDKQNEKRLMEQNEKLLIENKVLTGKLRTLDLELKKTNKLLEEKLTEEKENKKPKEELVKAKK